MGREKACANHICSKELHGRGLAKGRDVHGGRQVLLKPQRGVTVHSARGSPVTKDCTQCRQGCRHVVTHVSLAGT